DPEQLGLLPGRLQLLALAEVGCERHHLAAVGLLEPLEDDRRIEPARIGKHHLLDLVSGLRSHRKSCSCAEIRAHYRPRFRRGPRGACAAGVRIVVSGRIGSDKLASGTGYLRGPRCRAWNSGTSSLPATPIFPCCAFPSWRERRESRWSGGPSSWGRSSRRSAGRLRRSISSRPKAAIWSATSSGWPPTAD